MSRIEFKPPSDFTNSDSGSGGGNKVWKVLGIGCAVILVLVGIALAFGAWKTVSCCDTAKDFMVKGTMAREMALEVGNNLKAEKFESVRSRMSPALASEISVEQLGVQRREYASFFGSASPRIVNISNKNGNTWTISVEFAPPTQAQKLVLLMDIDAVDGESPEDAALVLDKLVFEQRRRDLRAEPGAVVVLGFHHALRRGDDEKAYEFVQSRFPEMSTFRSFLGEQKPIFREGIVAIKSVENRPNSSMVIAEIGAKTPNPVRVEYEIGPIRPGMNTGEIRKITPTYSKLDTGDTTAEKKADAGQDESPESASPDALENEAGDSDRAGEEAGANQ